VSDTGYTYLLKRIPHDLWKRAQKRAQADQIDLRTAILTMLDYYAESGSAARS
jgi:hypothetical protein